MNLRRVWVVPAFAALVLGAASCSPDPPRVALYSDSLGAQARALFQAQLAGEARVRGASVPGSALCDALPLIADDLDGAEPRLAVIQFSGNNGTDCMRGPDGAPLEGDAVVEKYDADARFAVEALVGAGVPVLLVGSPPTLVADTPRDINTALARIADEYRARGADVTYVDAGASVTTPDGSYAASLPCLPFETSALGCVDGQIAVRAPDGVHFCPTGTGDDPDCPVWSSGAYRFASAMAAPVLEALEAERTTTTPSEDDLNGRA